MNDKTLVILSIIGLILVMGLVGYIGWGFHEIGGAWEYAMECSQICDERFNHEAAYNFPWYGTKCTCIIDGKTVYQVKLR